MPGTIPAAASQRCLLDGEVVDRVDLYQAEGEKKLLKAFTGPWPQAARSRGARDRREEQRKQ